VPPSLVCSATLNQYTITPSHHIANRLRESPALCDSHPLQVIGGIASEVTGLAVST
jgi:hypothetical protein